MPDARAVPAPTALRISLRRDTPRTSIFRCVILILPLTALFLAACIVCAPRYFSPEAIGFELTHPGSHPHYRPGREQARFTRTRGMSLEFGVFDHLDRNDLPLHRYYEQRLRVIEAFDRFKLLRLPRRGAPLHAARYGAVAKRVPLRDRATHDPPAFRPFRLCIAGSSSFARGRRNLHARPHERRPAGDRLRPRLGAIRDCLLRPEC